MRKEIAAIAAAMMVTSSVEAADILNGKALVEAGNCAACHGAGLNKPVSPDYPKIAGQYADYLYSALRAYRTDAGIIVGRSNAIMKAQVMQNPGIRDASGKPRSFTLSELKSIAAYISSLPGDLLTKQ
ncbi:Cytochrome c4 [Pandoraea terrae]|uniref:Cytochrome c4 n=1 Tax=Pandoraea terrae TaxID=1537710 RepID=A0A5E4VAV7_9BURK|nr:c-type cytochrome [Pandoraea terrae]VVE08704.1 Cytochrome c4 [Pandoraea terrae]